MFKTKEELQKLKKEIAIQDDFIHDLYGSLIRHLNREIGDYSVTEKDEDSNAELHKKCFFLEIEIRDRERKKEKEEEAKVTDMTGDMTDIEFELIVDEVHERMEDWIYQIGKQRIRKMLDFYRADLSTLQSMGVNFRFECNSDFFNQMLGRIRREKNE